MVHAKMHLNPLMPLSMKSLQKVLLIGCLLICRGMDGSAQVSHLSQAHARDDPWKDATRCGFLQCRRCFCSWRCPVGGPRPHPSGLETHIDQPLWIHGKTYSATGGRFTMRNGVLLMIDFKSEVRRLMKFASKSSNPIDPSCRM